MSVEYTHDPDAHDDDAVSIAMKLLNEGEAPCRVLIAEYNKEREGGYEPLTLGQVYRAMRYCLTCEQDDAEETYSHAPPREPEKE